MTQSVYHSNTYLSWVYCSRAILYDINEVSCTSVLSCWDDHGNWSGNSIGPNQKKSRVTIPHILSHIGMILDGNREYEQCREFKWNTILHLLL